MLVLNRRMVLKREKIRETIRVAEAEAGEGIEVAATKERIRSSNSSRRRRALPNSSTRNSLAIIGVGVVVEGSEVAAAGVRVVEMTIVMRSKQQLHHHLQ